MLRIEVPDEVGYDLLKCELEEEVKTKRVFEYLYNDRTRIIVVFPTITNPDLLKFVDHLNCSLHQSAP